MLGVLAAAVFYGAIGVAALVRPRTLLIGFGILAADANSRNEIRAVYGGFPLAVCGLLLFTLFSPELADGVLFALALCSLGMAIGRLISAAVDRAFGKMPILFTVLELIVAAIIANAVH